MGLRIAIDTGGTFTDVVAIDDATGEISAVKTPSTPSDPSIGPARRRARRCSWHLDRRPEDVSMLLHGSTVATNAVLEHKFDGLGLLVTRGFRHMIEIARQSVPDGYGNSFFWVKPPRLVPLHLVREVPGRLRFDGSEIEPVDEEATLSAVRELVEDGVQLHRRLPASTPTPTAQHERAVGELIARELSRRLRVAVLGRAAGVPRIRAGDDDADRRPRQALLQDLSAKAPRDKIRARLGRHPVPDHAVERRRREACHRRRAAGDHAPLRACGGHPRLDPHGEARRLQEHPHHRRRRHLDRRRHHRRPTSPPTPPPPWSRAIPSRRRCSTS